MKRLFFLTLAVFFSFMFSCNNLFADNVYGAVNKKYLRVRAKPNTRSEVKETLYRNDRVTVLERSGKWFKIKTSSNKGWVKSKYISNSSFIASDTIDTSSDESSPDKPTDSTTDTTMDTTSNNPMLDTPVMSTSSFNTKGNSNINQNNNSNKDSSNDTGKTPNQKTFNSTSTNSSNFNLSTTKSNKILPKMNKTASKDKIVELSNEIDNINNKDEDF